MNAYVTIDGKYIVTRPSYASGLYIVHIVVDGEIIFSCSHKDERTALGIAVSHVNELVSMSKH